MTGMEQMALNLLAKMTGLTPEEMQRMANNAIGMLASLDRRLENIERTLDILHSYQTGKVIDVQLLEHSDDSKDN